MVVYLCLGPSTTYFTQNLHVNLIFDFVLFLCNFCFLSWKMGDGKRRMRQSLNLYILFFLLYFFIFLEWKFPSSFDVLVKGSAALSGEKRTMGYKVRWGTFSRDLCNNIDKLTKNLFTFYSLESPTEEEENLNEQLVVTWSKVTFVGVKKLGFICNEYRQFDSNA